MTNESGSRARSTVRSSGETPHAKLKTGSRAPRQEDRRHGRRPQSSPPFHPPARVREADKRTQGGSGRFSRASSSVDTFLGERGRTRWRWRRRSRAGKARYVGLLALSPAHLAPARMHILSPWSAIPSTRRVVAGATAGVMVVAAALVAVLWQSERGFLLAGILLLPRLTLLVIREVDDANKRTTWDNPTLVAQTSRETRTRSALVSPCQRA
jgi:hypothetical protein